MLATKSCPQGDSNSALHPVKLSTYHPSLLPLGDLPWGQRRKFEDSGVSCFAEPTLRDVIHAAPTQIADGEPLIGGDLVVANGFVSGFADGCLSDALETSSHLSGQAFAKNGPISNTGKKKEVLLDDVGEKIVRLSTSGNGIMTCPVYASASGSGESANNTLNGKRDVRFLSSGNLPQEPSKDIKESLEIANVPLNDLDSMEELGVDTDIGAPQDISTWFNFDVDGLQDHASVGLEIPMDDLSELNMF